MNISCKEITKVFGKSSYALKGFSLDIKSGDFVVVMGESGCGKTTLLRVIAGLLKPESGEVYLDGVPSNNIPAQDRNCAMIFQNYSLYPNYSVYDNVAFYLKSKGLSQAELRERIDPILEFFGLSLYANVKPRFLSGGQQQRVCLAKALVRRPKLLLFDEPLSNIDEKARENYLRLIKETKKLMPDTTYVYVTHNSHEATYLADKIAIMLDGSVRDYGEVEKLHTNPQILDTVYMLGGANVPIKTGRLSGGKFISQEGEEIIPHEFCFKTGDMSDREFVKYYKAYPDRPECYFDENGNSLCGVKDIAYFGVEKDEGNIIYNGQRIRLTSEQEKGFIGQDGKLLMGINLSKLHTNKCYGDFSVKVEKVYASNGVAVYSDGVNNFAMYLDKDISEFYYPIEDIVLYNEKREKVLIKSAIYKNELLARVSRGMLKVGKCKFEVDCEDGLYNVEFLQDSYISLTTKKTKNSLYINECIGEDYIGDKKCVFLLSDYFEKYLTFRVPAEEKLLARKKFYVLIDTSKIKLKRAKNG